MNYKKLPITILLLLLTLTTTSCEPNNWRINYLIPGYFIGVNTYNEEETFYLAVKEITLEDELGDASMLSGVAKFPARIKCATLAWKALDKAIANPTETKITEEIKHEE